MDIVQAEIELIDSYNGQPQINRFAWLADLSATHDEDEIRRRAKKNFFDYIDRELASSLRSYKCELVDRQIREHCEATADD